MTNPIAAFLRNEIALSKEARRLGLHTRVWTEGDVHLFFNRAADEIDAMRASLAEMLAAFWQEGDGKEPPEFIQRAIDLTVPGRKGE